MSDDFDPFDPFAPGGSGAGPIGPDGHSTSAPPSTNTGAGNNNTPFNFNPASFDLPKWAGPYSAPVTQGGLDALQGFNTMVGATQPFNINKLMDDASGLSNFKLPGANVPQAGLNNAFGTALSAPRFDTTEMFRNADVAFQSDLAKQLAKIKEEFSNYGMGPGSTDRNERLLGEAGTQLAKFNVGKLDIGRQSFEDSETRRIGAINSAPNVVSMLELPSRLALAEHGANVNALNPLTSLAQLPYNMQLQKFQVNSAARDMADTDIMRQIQENARTQGGGLNQLLSILSGTPLNNSAIGPSDFSQFSNLVGQFIPDSVVGK